MSAPRLWRLATAIRIIGEVSPGLKSTPLVRADGRECTTLSVDVTGPTGKRWRLTERASHKAGGGWTDPVLKVFPLARNGTPCWGEECTPEGAAGYVLGRKKFEFKKSERCKGPKEPEHAPAYVWFKERR